MQQHFDDIFKKKVDLFHGKFESNHNEKNRRIFF